MSGDRRHRVWTYLTDGEKAHLSEWAEECGKSESQLLREAIMEYLDKDRTARLEEEVSEINEKLDDVQALLADGTHTHKEHDRAGGRVTRASDTVAKTREIAERLRENYETGVSESNLERAIKDIAGADPRTLEKYREELAERGHAYPHPAERSDAWYLDRSMWLQQVRSYLESVGEPRSVLAEILDGTPVKMQDVVGEQIPEEVVADV
jgi:type I site-specific restriction-modification system R (restriction) subunit